MREGLRAAASRRGPFAFGLSRPVLLIGLGAAVIGALCAPPGQTLAMAALHAGLFLIAMGLGRGLSAGVRAPLPVELEALLGVAVIAHAAMLPALAALPYEPTVLVVAALGLGALALRRGPPPDASPAAEALVLCAALGFAALWAADSAARYAVTAETGVFRLWLDAFVHGGTIAEFGDPRAIGRGSSGLADVPAVLYHAASHALAALAVRLADVAPLDAVVALWLPVGALAMMLGVVALGRALGGLAGAALVCAGLALLPDASAYGLRQGFFGFHWMLETSPGTLYGLGTALGSIALLLGWVAGGGWGRLGLSILLLAATFMLRAHVFVWLVVPWLVTAWLALPWPGRRLRLALLASGALAAVPALLWIAREEIATVGLVPFLTRYLDALHRVHEPTAYDGFYPWLSSLVGPLGAAPLGVALAMAGMSGLWLATFAIGMWLAARRGLLSAGDALPVALLAWAAALQMLAPTPYHGDVSDFRQRAFVLVAVVLIVWSGAFALRLAPGFARPLPAAALACLSLLATPLWLPDAKAGRMRWASDFSDFRVAPGLMDAARWIRAEAGADDAVLVAGLSAREMLFDDAAAIAGVSGVPAWLSRRGIMRASGPPRAEVAEARANMAAAVHAEPDLATAVGILKGAGVGFYVARAGDMPAWDPTGARADFRSGEFLVWRAARRDIAARAVR